MGTILPYPPTATPTDDERQLVVLRRYMYRLVDELNRSINSLETTVSSVPTLADQSAKAGGSGGSSGGGLTPEVRGAINKTAGELKSLIIRTAEAAEEEIERIDGELGRKKSISTIQEQYYKSTSSSETTGGSWVNSYPGWENGYYIWTRSIITYDNGTSTTTAAVCVTGSQGQTGAPGQDGAPGAPGAPGVPGRDGQDGQDGQDGVGISDCDVQYASHNSSTTPPVESSSAWQTTMPEIEEGHYIWTRTRLTYDNGNVEYSGIYCMSTYTDDIVDPKIAGVYSYAERIENTLESEYLAVSDFGVYRENVDAHISETAERIEQSISATNSVVGDYINTTNGYIRQGIVGHDAQDVPIIGIAIGQDVEITGVKETVNGKEYDTIDTRHNMSIWTTEKLSFYVNGAEVAYFANNALHVSRINAGGITMNEKWSIDHTTNGFVVRWIGGES